MDMPSLEFHLQKGKAIFILQRALLLENFKVDGKLLKGHQVFFFMPFKGDVLILITNLFKHKMNPLIIFSLIACMPNHSQVETHIWMVSGT